MLRDVDAEKLLQQVLQSVTVGVGAHHLAGNLGAVDRGGQSAECVIHRSNIKAAKVEQLQNLGVFQHPRQVGRRGLTFGNLHKMRMAVARRHLNQTQTISVGVKPHRLAINGYNRPKIEIIRQVALIQMVGHDTLPFKTIDCDRNRDVFSNIQ